MEKKNIDGGLSDPLPVKRVYDWGYRNIVLLRTHTSDIKPIKITKTMLTMLIQMPLGSNTTMFRWKTVLPMGINLFT